MKFGYLFYQKPINPQMKSRPINIGDAIQSYAVKLLYKEMGIDEKDIIPIPRYDLKDYAGEECICVVNGITDNYEYAYDNDFLPASDNIHVIVMSLHLHRKIFDDEYNFYKKCGSIGCRDFYTMEFFKKLGLDAYMSGCLTLTFPKRSQEIAQKANKKYFIDIENDIFDKIPSEIKEGGLIMSNIYRHQNDGKSVRLTEDETYEEHMIAEQRIQLLRDTAKLVVTGRLHIAAPCLAMGIPVILIKSHFDDRFGFIDGIMPIYGIEDIGDINWNPESIDISEIKDNLKKLFFSRINSEIEKIKLDKLWTELRKDIETRYESEEMRVVRELNFSKSNFKYVVWGCVLRASFSLEEAIEVLYPEARLIAGVDSMVEGKYCNVNIIKPEEILNLDEEIIVFVPAVAAHKSAIKLLANTKRSFVLIDGIKTESYNWN